MQHLRTVLYILLLVIFAAEGGRAQFRSGFTPTAPPSVLHPAPSRWWIGPQLGAGINSQRGDFTTEFCNCSFEDGSGVGLSAGIELGHFLSENFAVALKAVYNDFRADYSYSIILPAYVVDEDENPELLDVEHIRSNTVVLSYMMINPVLQFFPFGGLYVTVGPGIGISTTATQEYALEFTDEFLIYVGDPERRVIERDSGTLPDANGFRADVRVGAGYNIRLARSFTFAPEFSYVYPLTRIGADENWFAESFQLVGVFKFEL